MYIQYKKISIRILMVIIITIGSVSCRNYKELAKVSQPDDRTVRKTLSHGVDYGIWLELAHEKNYAVIAPTVRKEGPRIVDDLSNLMSRLRL